MSVQEIKEELRRMEAPALQELTSYILQLRRVMDPERPARIADKLDSKDTKWVSLEEMEKRLGCE
ncbi:hypothetical protein [Cerasicoccus fimbriatus]|uniref:hypothetical protein n=1 Tax=Cerasicoccus fimbriatus TaxID=3014554 RepID=UPI0022B30202|nr:hypothetical protein [Cerasicoccus sp. TK19100]